jgi:hypothetical protein
MEEEGGRGSVWSIVMTTGNLTILCLGLLAGLGTGCSLVAASVTAHRLEQFLFANESSKRHQQDGLDSLDRYQPIEMAEQSEEDEEGREEGLERKV